MTGKHIAGRVQAVDEEQLACASIIECQSKNVVATHFSVANLERSQGMGVLPA